MSIPAADQAKAAELLESIRAHAENGRLHQLILTPMLEWGPNDEHLIKAVLCMVASRMIWREL